MIVVDVECTGLDPRRHSLLSIGAVDFNRPGRTFYGECKAFSGAELTEDGLRVSGFSAHEALDPNKQALEELLDCFFHWTANCQERTLAGHNPDFDRDFLRAGAERCGLRWCLGHRVVDLHSLAYGHQLSRGLLPPNNSISAITSDEVHRYAGLPEEPRPHHALVGASMEAEDFSRLLFGQTLLQQFHSFPVPSHLALLRPRRLAHRASNDLATLS